MDLLRSPGLFFVRGTPRSPRSDARRPVALSSRPSGGSSGGARVPTVRLRVEGISGEMRGNFDMFGMFVDLC